MRKSHIAIALLASVLVAPMVMAKPDKSSLAEISADGCAVDATMLQASWTWTSGTIQTTFGGDAVFLADVSEGDTLIEEGFEVEFELTALDAEGNEPGELVYDCDATDADGSCSASMMGVDEAIAAAILEEFGEGYTFLAAFDSVYVKAKNPGKGNGRQDYKPVDVCAVEVLIESP